MVGEILEIYPHPNADKIRLTKTRIAPGEAPLEIVCGAWNIQVGDRIPVALPGSQVLDRQEGKPYKLIAKPVRGVVSNGMLCSPSELGLSTTPDGTASEDGILIFSRHDDKFELGKDVRELLSLYPDYILHVEPRSNRGDALSVIGLAREAAALLSRPLRSPDWHLPAEQNANQRSATLDVSIENPDDCPFFSVRIIHSVSAGLMPPSMLRRLENIGIRSVNGIVDITNYVMHEFGQPLHAYDLQKIKGNFISVRRGQQSEKLETLDGKSRQLNNEVLVIADRQSVVGIAGVMGGKESEISDGTRSIALEAAAFNAARVRRSSRLLGLASDSSLRFERGVDPANVVNASNRAAYLILQYCRTGEVQPDLGGLSTAGSDQVPAMQVELRLCQLKKILSVEFDAQQVTDLISPLAFQITAKDKEKLLVSVPSFRQKDVTREIDLVEEVCRLWGYDKVPVTMPESTVMASPQDDTQARVVAALTAQGLNEAWLSSLTSSSGQDPAIKNGDNGGMANAGHIFVLNPLSADHQVLRLSLLPGLLQAASYNAARKAERVWLFEIGRIYQKSADSPFGTGVIEPTMVAGILVGDRETGWQADHAHELDFYQTRGVVENLLANLHIDMDKIRFSRSEDKHPLLHPGRSSLVSYAQGKNLSRLGWLGEMHPALADKYKFGQAAYLFELNLDLLKPLRQKITFKGVPSTLPMQRDITVDVLETVDYATVRSCIVSEAGKHLQELELVSTFKPGDGQKSLSFRLWLQGQTKALTGDEVDNLMTKVRNSLGTRVGATFRS